MDCYCKRDTESKKFPFHNPSVGQLQTEQNSFSYSLDVILLRTLKTLVFLTYV